ncbi:MAG: hypothetical protein OES90_11450, partial [Xanthomonadales bacterium]|nr:hypothetical protein [Xanthomonadales bacterium]
MRTTILMLLLAMTTACEKTATWEGSLDSLLASRPDQFLTVTQNRDKYRVQVIYTQIDRTP